MLIVIKRIKDIVETKQLSFNVIVEVNVLFCTNKNNEIKHLKITIITLLTNNPTVQNKLLFINLNFNVTFPPNKNNIAIYFRTGKQRKCAERA